MSKYNETTDVVIIPEGVRKIGSYAFSSCDSLKNIELPQTLEVIEHSAF